MNYTHEQVEKYLLSLGLLKFVDVDSISHTSSLELVHKFFHYNGECNSHLAGHSDMKEHTRENRRRSLGDIFRICRYYNETITLKDVQEHLMELCGQREIGGLICADINKRVWRNSYAYFMCHTFDEFGFDYTELIKKYSVRQEYTYADKTSLKYIQIPTENETETV